MRPLNAPSLLLTLAMMLWSGNILLGRAMHAEFTPTSMAFWRWSVALLILSPLTLRRVWAMRAELAREWKAFLLMGMFGVAAFNWCLYQAVNTTTATNAALIYATVPVFIVVVSWLFLGERVTGRQMAGIAISTLGVVAVITRGDPAAIVDWDFTPGDLWALATVPIWGVYTLLLRRRPASLPPLVFLTAIVIAGLVFLTPLYLIEVSATGGVAWGWATVGTVAYLSLFASIAGFSLWNGGVAGMGANRAGLYSHLYPLFTTVLAILFLGETLRIYHGAGAALIFGGLYLTTFAGGFPGPADNAAAP